LDPNFCVATNMTPEKAYGWLKIINFYNDNIIFENAEI